MDILDPFGALQPPENRAWKIVLTTRVMLRSYGAAVNDKDNELVHLYKIRNRPVSAIDSRKTIGSYASGIRVRQMPY